MGAFSHPRALSSSMTSCSAYWTLSFPAPIQDAEECTFLADKGYDVKAIYNLIRDAYHGEAVIPLNKRGTKNPKLFSFQTSVCFAHRVRAIQFALQRNRSETSVGQKWEKCWKSQHHCPYHCACACVLLISEFFLWLLYHRLSIAGTFLILFRHTITGQT